MKETSEFDIAIVGAGPAGSSAAIRLAQSGRRVCLIEQKKFPREKLCGEFISPECLAHFAELRVIDEMSLAGGMSLERTIFYARNGRSVTVPSEWFGSGSHALGLSRARMDEVLMNRARSAGARVLEETQAIGMLFKNETVIGLRLRDQRGEGFEISSRLTFDATGRSRILSRQIEKAARSEKRNRAKFVAFKTHLENAAIRSADCEIYAYRGGYGGCSPVEGDRYNLCFIVASDIAKAHGGDAERIMRAVVFANTQAARALKNARVVDSWWAVPIESYGRNELAPANGLLTIGDAAAFIDPFTGSGILLALESSKIAAAVVTDCRPQTGPKSDFTRLAAEYDKRYGAEMDRRLRVSSLLRRIAFAPLLAETVIKGMALSEGLTHRLARATRPK